MVENNICKFVPARVSSFNLDAKNFVFERRGTNTGKLQILSAYRVYLVVQGKGIFHTARFSFPLSRGTVFFTFPATPFEIENTEELQYFYITALGLRFKELVGRIGASPESAVVSGHEELLAFWQQALEGCSDCSLDLAAESVILYTFSALCRSDEKSAEPGLVPKVKLYLDEHYHEETLCLKTVSRQLQYNEKYVSSVFKKSMGVGVCEYLHVLRIRHACELIEKGVHSVKELAYLTGFSDPSYFSRVFKQQMQLYPREFIRQKEKK